MWLLVSVNALSHVHSFTTRPTALTLLSRNAILMSQPHLYAVASRPAEGEMEKEKKREEIDDADWTPTRGGFLPNLGRRRRSRLIQEVVTMEDYKTVVVDEEERMVVVRFFAPWCRACHSVAPLYEQLAAEYSPSVKFVQVPLTKTNGHLHEGLGVPSLPFAHIYDPNVGLCEEMSMNKRTFSKFRDTLETYIDGSCDLPDV